jgi:hypothetical protein
MEDGDGQPPILRVKRGLRYLDEGLPPLEPPAPPPPGRTQSPYRGGRFGPRRPGRFGKTSTLLSLILVGLAFLLVFLSQNRAPNKGSIGGYSLELRAAVVGREAAASVSVTRPGGPPRGEETARILFSLPDTGVTAGAEGRLGAASVLGARLPLAGTERRLEAQVTIGDETRTLSLRIRLRRSNP